MFFCRAISVICCIAAIFSSTRLEAAKGVSLFWDPSPQPEIAGYKVAVGTAPGSYDQSIDVHARTNATIPNLNEGVTYFFSVTAYTNSLMESDPSNEVSYSVPTPTPSPTPTPTPGPTVTPTPGPTATPTPTPIPTPSQGELVNVSTRGGVDVGDNVLIGGVVITGNAPKRVLLRAIGPSLTQAGVTGALQDPTLTLHDGSGAVIAANDNWRLFASAVQATGYAPSADAESAIVTTLSPGSYTAIISGVGGSRGIALFELYDLQPESGRVANISTRGKVGTGDMVMIGGFVVTGSQPAQLVVRAIGPSLAAAGVPDVLADPVLELYNSTGSRIFVNDNWRAEQESQIADSALAPQDSQESAMIVTLSPGAYTAIVRGARGTTGVALVEVYYVGK